MATFNQKDKQRALDNARKQIGQIKGSNPDRQADHTRGYVEALAIVGVISTAEYSQLLREVDDIEQA